MPKMLKKSSGKTPDKKGESLYERAKSAGKRILYTGAILSALAGAPSCSSNNGVEKKIPKTEQSDTTHSIEMKPITRDIKQNPDGTYSLYAFNNGEKLSDDYVMIRGTKYIDECFIGKKIIDGEDKYCLLNKSGLEISEYYDGIDDDLIYQAPKPEKMSEDVIAIGPGEFSFTATVDGKKVLIENGKEISGHYDEIKAVEFGGIVGKTGGKEYYENNGTITGPVDDVVFAQYLGNGTGEYVVLARNNGQNEFYYQGQPILKLPLSQLSNDECFSVLQSFHFNDGLCYTYPDKGGSIIVSGEKKIKSKYSHIDNIQNYNGKVVYLGWNDEDMADGIPMKVFIVTEGKTVEINGEDNWKMIEQLRKPDTSLGFYATYGYFND